MSELNEETSGTTEGTTEETVVEGQGGESTTSETLTEGGEGEAGAKAEGETPQDEPEFIEQDGKKMVPYERFKQINDEKKAGEEAKALLETLRTDPEARKQFFGEQGSEPKAPAQVPTAPTVTPVAKFIAESVPEESRQHYQGFVGAIEQHFDAKYEAKLNEVLAPIMKFVGGSIVKEARTTLPEFSKYEAKIMSLMASNPYLDVTAAYKQLRYDDLVKGQSIQKQKQQHQQKLNQKPLNKNPGSGSTAPKKAGDLREAFDRAWDKTQGA